MLYIKLNDQYTKPFYLFLQLVLPKFVWLNKQFQTENVIITKVYKKMCNTYKDILLCYMNRNYVQQNCLDQVDANNVEQFVDINCLYLEVGVMQNLNNLKNTLK